MKKLLKNKTFLSMIIGVLIAYISLITCFFIKNQTYFTIMFISNVVINFGVIIYNIVKYDLETEKFKSVTQAAYVLLTVVALVLDVVIMSSSWNMNLYDNVMYLSNIEMYLTIYILFMLVVMAMNLYYVIKEKNRQNSTNEITNNKK